MAQSMIQREAVRAGADAPNIVTRLTEKGLRQTGSNFTDLAMALWREFRSIRRRAVRREMLRRMAKALASGYANQIQRQHARPSGCSRLAELLDAAADSVSVETARPASPTLTAHACPYPKLAEEDRERLRHGEDAVFRVGRAATLS